MQVIYNSSTIQSATFKIGDKSIPIDNVDYPRTNAGPAPGCLPTNNLSNMLEDMRTGILRQLRE